MFCGSCGRALEGQSFCRGCGSPASPLAPTGPSQPALRASNRTGITLLIAALVGLTVVALGVVAFLVVGRSGTPASPDKAEVAGATVSPSSSPSATASAATTTTPAPSSTGPGPVSGLPAGLFCRDLNAKGYSYTAAVEYWRLHGQPNQMDAERNGIPCETVYPATDVTAYWGPRPSASYVYDSGFDSLPAGLFCRDLSARGLSYADAVAYWGYWGQPDRMDDDLNGIPCETVYSSYDVSSYWG